MVIYSKKAPTKYINENLAFYSGEIFYFEQDMSANNKHPNNFGKRLR